MTLLLVSILAVGAREPGRIETRYTFFLYPLVMALGLTGIMALVESRLGTSQAPWRSALRSGFFSLDSRRTSSPSTSLTSPPGRSTFGSA